MNRLFKIVILFALVAVLFGSCKHDAENFSSEELEYKSEEYPEYTFDKWNSNDPFYKIIYDTATDSFSSDYENVVFLVTTKTDFVIVNFGDIQIENSNLSDSDPKVRMFREIVRKAIDVYHPDLLTFTGDFGDYGRSSASLKKVSEILDSFGLPWAPVFGNHDNESVKTIEKAKLLEKYKNCLFKSGPDNLATIDHLVHTNIPALGNYVVNVVRKTDNPRGYDLINSLIFMNTGSLRYFSQSEINSEHSGKIPFGLTNSWGSLKDNQIDWYEWAVKSAQQTEQDVKSSLFVHIPIFAYVYAHDAAYKGAPSIYNTLEFLQFTRNISYEESFNPDIWNEEYKDSFGVFHDTNLGTSMYDDFVFESIKELGSTNLVVCGHDHNNNTVINYKDVKLVYTTKTGRGSYYERGLCGATAITVNSNSTSVEHLIFEPVVN